MDETDRFKDTSSCTMHQEVMQVSSSCEGGEGRQDKEGRVNVILEKEGEGFEKGKGRGGGEHGTR